MSNDEYYKYFNIGAQQKVKDSFIDEFLEDKRTLGGKSDKDEFFNDFSNELEPKAQTSDIVGKKLLKDIINKQLDKEWDMEKIIMKYQLSPEQIDKILYESKAWESEIIGGKLCLPNKNSIFGGKHSLPNKNSIFYSENKIFFGGTFYPNEFKILVDSYLNLFEKSWDFLTRYLRTFQIIAEMEEQGGKDQFLPKSADNETNIKQLSSFLKIIEEIRGNAEVPLAFSDIKIDILFLADQLLNTGIQHHNLPVTKFIQSESKEAYKSFVNAAAVKPAVKHSFINEMYKYDLRDPNRFYTDGIHRNAISGYVKYKKFIESTTGTLGENFVDILIHIYNILMKCVEYYKIIKKDHPDFILPELEKHFSKENKYLSFLKEVKQFLKNPTQRNVTNAKKLISLNSEAFKFQSSAVSQSEVIVPAELEKGHKEEQKVEEDKRCILNPEPNILGYLNIADFIEEAKAEQPKPEIKEAKPEIKEAKPEIKEEKPQILDFIEEVKQPVEQQVEQPAEQYVAQKEPFDIMHMITEPSSVASLVTPVESEPEVIPAVVPTEPLPTAPLPMTPLPITPLQPPTAPLPPPIPEFKSFKVTPPPPIAPLPPPIPKFKGFKVTPPAPIPPAPIPPPIRGFRPMVIPPKPLAKAAILPTIPEYGLVMKNEIDDSSRGISVEYRVLPKLSEKRDPYRVKVMFIIAYNLLACGHFAGVTMNDLASHANSFSGKTDNFLNDLIMSYFNSIGFTYASNDALFVYVKYLKNGGVALIDKSDIYNFVNAYDVVVEKLYNLRKV